MKKTKYLAVLALLATMLTACGGSAQNSAPSANNNANIQENARETSHETASSAGQNSGSGENSGTDENTPSSAATGNAAAGNSNTDYSYPESIRCENAPYQRTLTSTSPKLAVTVPGFYDFSTGTVSAPYYVKRTGEDKKGPYFCYAVTTVEWYENVPDWMSAEEMTYSLEQVPDFMYSRFIDYLEEAGKDSKKHYSAFKKKNTTLSEETKETIEIDGHRFIRHSGIASASVGDFSSEVYFSVLYTIAETESPIGAPDTGTLLDHGLPVMIFTGSQDTSEAGRRIIDDTMDFTVANISFE